MNTPAQAAPGPDGFPRAVSLLLDAGHGIDHMFPLIFAAAVAAIAADFGYANWTDLMPYGVGAFALFGLGALPAGRLGDLWGRRIMMVIFFVGMGCAALLVSLAQNAGKRARHNRREICRSARKTEAGARDAIIPRHVSVSVTHTQRGYLQEQRGPGATGFPPCAASMTRSAASAAADEESQQYPHWRRNLRMLPLANLLCSLGFGLSWPFVPLMVRGLGVRENLETWVGYMLLVFYLISFAVNPIWGGIADHYGRKLMVLRAMLGMGFAMILVPLASTPIGFASLFMLIGVFNGFTPAGIALLVANTPPTRIGSAVSLAQTGGLVGQALGPAVGAVLAALIDRQHWLFWISAGLMLSGGTLVALFVREVKQLAPGPWRPQWVSSLRALLAVPRVGLLYLLAFLFSVMWYGSVTNISVFVLQLLEAQPADSGTEAFWVGAAAMALALSMVVAMPLWGRVLDRVGPARVLAFAAAAAAVTHLPLLVLQTPLQLVLARVAFGLTAAAMPPAIFQLLRIHAPPGMDARAISYATAFQFFAMGLAPFAAGLIGPVLGLRAYFALTIVAMLGGLGLWLRTERARNGKSSG